MDRDQERRRPCTARPPPVRRLLAPLPSACRRPGAAQITALTPPGTFSAADSDIYRRNQQLPIPTFDAERHDRVTGALPSAAVISSGAILERQLFHPHRLTIRQTRQAEIREAAASSCALKIGHLNVRSLTAHLDEVNLLLLREQLDVLCLSETWLTEAVESSVLLFPGYAITRLDRKARKTGGGVAVLHRCTLRVEQLRVPAEGSTLEALWLRVIDRTAVIVGTMYRPPSGPTAPAIDDLHRQLTSILAHNQPMYVLGDFNFDILHPAKPGVSTYIQHLDDLSLHQMITGPTHPGPTPRR